MYLSQLLSEFQGSLAEGGKYISVPPGGRLGYLDGIGIWEPFQPAQLHTF